MSVLVIYPENGSEPREVLNEPRAIGECLEKAGVLFQRWQATKALSDDDGQEAVIDAYRDDVDRLMKKYDFQSVDVISLTPDHPEKVALRAKFLGEHTHSDFEVRFFVEGRGLFYIHADDVVYGLMCEAGDLISVPANLPHWFDMGEEPAFKCIRLFTTPDGWEAQYTEDAIAARFPSFEKFQGLFQ